MKGAKENVLQAIGNTPIVKLNKVTGNLKSEIYVKLEYLNPGGSIKERIGVYILEKAMQAGKLKPGGTVIEGTSGNTGVGLAMYAAVHSLKCIFVLADKQSPEKIQNLRAFGAKVIVCPTNVEPDDPRSYYSVSKNLAKTIPNSYFVSQYDNPWNLETHYQTTGPEIWQQTQGDFDVFMAGVGTGGTISGIGKYLKEKKPSIKVVGVDCEGSILAHYAKTKKMIPAQSYVLEGIGEDFLPGNVKFETIDDWVVVGDKESFLMTRKLLTHEGIYCGGSCGAAVVGAIRYAEQMEHVGKILVVLPDSGNRYSSKIFNDDWMRDKGYLDSSLNVLISEVIKNLNLAQIPLYSLPESSTIEDCVTLFNQHGISHIPIIADNHVSGVVSEKLLSRPLMEGKLSLSDSVTVGMHQKFEVIDENQLLSEVTDALMEDKIVFIKTNQGQLRILTHSDVLKFIAKMR